MNNADSSAPDEKDTNLDGSEGDGFAIQEGGNVADNQCSDPGESTMVRTKSVATTIAIDESALGETIEEVHDGVHLALDQGALERRRRKSKRSTKGEGSIIRSATPSRLTPPNGIMNIVFPNDHDSPTILEKVDRRSAIQVESENEDNEGPKKYTRQIKPNQQIPTVLEKAHEKLYTAGHTYVEIQPLSDHMELGSKRFLYKHLNNATATRIKLLQCMMQNQDFFVKKGILREQITSTEGYYEAAAVFKSYLAGRIVLETQALSAGFDTVKDYLFKSSGKGQFTPRDFLTIGPGDGDAVRGIHKVRRALMSLDTLRQSLNSPGPIRKKAARELLDEAEGEQISTREFYFDENLLSIDLTKTFPETLWCERNCRVISGDAGSPEILGMHKVGRQRTNQKQEKQNQMVELTHDSVDQFLAYNVLDRVGDRLGVYRNMKLLARPGARFQIALPTKITNVNKVGKEIRHWDESKDRRSTWMNPDESWAIFNMFQDFRMDGLITDRISMQPYMSLNPECIVDFADVLRKRGKEDLENSLRQPNGSIANEHLQILANLFDVRYSEQGIEPNFIFEDRDLVLFPEIYDIAIFSGYIDKDWPKILKAY